ncbi:chitinase [Streptacidiphilus sp. PB12-B1b]|uniref:glycosyl hydrolase family 18 protein n=1 Tax=Streptacidiphilus sp. PB12-B1b TaxID=2705012 RepID=UPI0015FC76F6|nr:glycosyl hydrolase family 18 protein [Streptacidiphilus sp. PB12-B1b]QMU77715.1 chitinase [Streptacidiphilus sp. PB12-B1b]
MRRTPGTLHTVVTGLLATAVASAGLLTAGAGAAHAAGIPSVHGAANSLPAHVYAPYFEAYNGDDPATLSAESGAKYLTMAFIETAAAGSCTAYWNGDTTEPLSSATFGSSIAAIQRGGGTVIPSFGGYAADTTGTDIADSCTDVNAIAKVYESVFTTYHATRIDLDVEADSLSNTAGITRRNQAIAEVEAWGARTGHKVGFQYTLPSATTGLGATGVAVLQNAVQEHARIALVNAMTFDYYIGTAQEMGTDAVTAANGVYSQLAALYPWKSKSQLWESIGLTLMPGIDDFGAAETTTAADVNTVESFAAGHGLGALSIWALQRDNGGCPGTSGAGTCSGVAQDTWAFSHTLEHFTSNRWGAERHGF